METYSLRILPYCYMSLCSTNQCIFCHSLCKSVTWSQGNFGNCFR